MRKLAYLALLVLALMAVSFGSYWHLARPDATCVKCHEIRPAHDLWTRSPHRDIKCDACHGSVLSNGFHSLWENSRRLATHYSDQPHDDLRLTEEQIVQTMNRCKACHEREFADWTSSGHSARYSDIFLHPGHNQTQQLNSDCLRCHGMFYEKTIEALVAPISVQGPWKMLDPGQASRPVIPCLACHEIHVKGGVASRPDYSNPKTIAADRPSRLPRLSFYDRREGRHFEAAILPAPALKEVERALVVAPDPRQRVCFQCHASVAFQKAGAGDDRTPRGVHEGLSCLSCHAMHSLDARHSCASCHPRLSNCGLDVAIMDTSFKSPESRHNIHFVACADCHPDGVPKKNEAAAAGEE
ncbi:MAG: multiheme c-type cytochrome [Acidobacteriota bacterium]